MNDEDPNQPSEAWCQELQETEQAMQANRDTPSSRFVLYLDPQRTVPMLFRYVPPTQEQWGTIEALMGKASPRKSEFQGR